MIKFIKSEKLHFKKKICFMQNKTFSKKKKKKNFPDKKQISCKKYFFIKKN